MTKKNLTVPQIRETIARLRETAQKLMAEGKTDEASEMMEKAAKLEDLISRTDAP